MIITYRPRLFWHPSIISTGFALGFTVVTTATAIEEEACLSTYHDEDILSQIQYHLVETVNAGASWSSGLWTVSEVIGYLNNRQRQFLAETGAVMTRSTLNTIPNTGRHVIPQGWILSQRVVWLDAEGERTTLHKADTWQADYGITDWAYATALKPKVFTETEVPQLEIQIVPASFDNGVIELTHVSVGDALGNEGECFAVPDEFVVIIKWGVMADMLSKAGRGQDLERAAYCEQRYQAGLEAVLLMLGAVSG